MKPRIMRLKCVDYTSQAYVTTGWWIDPATGHLLGWNELAVEGASTAEQERDSGGGWKARPGDEAHWPGLALLEEVLRANPCEGEKP